MDQDTNKVPDLEATDPGLTTEPAAAASPADVAALQKKASEFESKYLYLYAEFENFKKRSAREIADARKYGWESLALDLIEVIDNLERALAHAPVSDKTLSQGLTMVLNQFRAVLKKGGVQELESLQKAFDPNVHDAVSQEPSDLPEGTITQEHGRGYMLHGRLLRPARVVVSTGKAK